jgi:hypothetical protein
MGFALGGVLLLALFQSPPGGPATLGRELLSRNLPAPSDLADLEQPITSYSVLDDSRGFVIAYYALEPDNVLHELRVRSFDKRTRTWRSKTFPEPIGSVLRLHRGGGYLFISGHSSPSAAPLLVLTEALEQRRELDGWTELVLDDGRVVFQRSMIHFSPAHAGALALYDPVADREEPVFPPAAVKNKRGGEMVPGTKLWINRSIDDVKKGKDAGTIEFNATEQQIRLTPQNTPQPAGPERHLRVVCRLSVSPIACDVRSTNQDQRSGRRE